MAAGHAERDCPGEGEIHIELYRQGFGIAVGPPPSDKEIEQMTEADKALMADEFHGRNVAGQRVW